MRKLMELILLVICLVSHSLIFAGNFRVSPVRITLSEKNSIQSMNISNVGTQAMKFQIKINPWDDKRSSQFGIKQMVVTPPIFTLLPNQKQVVRVGYRSSRAQWPKEELKYQITLYQLPDSLPKKNKLSLGFKYQFHFPLFIEPLVPVKILSGQFIQSHDQDWILRLENKGNMHLCLYSLKLNLGKNELATYSKRACIMRNQEKDIVFNLSKQSLAVMHPSTVVELVASIGEGEMLKQPVSVVYTR